MSSRFVLQDFRDESCKVSCCLIEFILMTLVDSIVKYVGEATVGAAVRFITSYGGQGYTDTRERDKAKGVGPYNPLPRQRTEGQRRR